MFVFKEIYSIGQLVYCFAATSKHTITPGSPRKYYHTWLAEHTITPASPSTLSHLARRENTITPGSPSILSHLPGRAHYHTWLAEICSLPKLPAGNLLDASLLAERSQQSLAGHQPVLFYTPKQFPLFIHAIYELGSISL